MMAHLVSAPRFALGLMLAPLVSTFVVPVSYCGWAVLLNGRSASACAAALAGYGWYGLIPATLATILLGWPLSLLAIRFSWFASWHFAIGGALVGTVAASSLWLFDRALNAGGLVVLASATGASAALVLWLVGIRGNVAAIQ